MAPFVLRNESTRKEYLLGGGKEGGIFTIISAIAALLLMKAKKDALGSSHSAVILMGHDSLKRLAHCSHDFATPRRPHESPSYFK